MSMSLDVPFTETIETTETIGATGTAGPVAMTGQYTADEIIVTLPISPSGRWDQLTANEQAWIEFIRGISGGRDPRITQSRPVPCPCTAGAPGRGMRRRTRNGQPVPMGGPLARFAASLTCSRTVTAFNTTGTEPCARAG
jgi:hypothetical protein